MPAMRKRFSTNLKGMSLQQLIDVGDSLGLASRALQCPIDEVHKLTTLSILHWHLNHFVVLTKISGRGSHPSKGAKFSVNDPVVGKRTLTLEAFSKHFTGICLALTSPVSLKSNKTVWVTE